jgi:RecA/RadA recombinase
MGKHARAFSKFFRGKLDFFEYADAFLMASAQLKANIQTGFQVPGASKTTTIADGPFKFHSSWIIHMTHRKLKENDVDVGEQVVCTMTKNKLAPKNRKLVIHLYRDGRGWDFTKANIDLLFSNTSPFPDEFSGSGGWYRHSEINDGKNLRAPQFVEAFYAHPTLLDRCREKLRIRGFGYDFETNYSFDGPQEDNDASPA